VSPGRLLFVSVWAVLLALASEARAETLQAPVGGKAIALGDGRIVCPGGAGDWSVEPGGRAVRPPAADDHGRDFDLLDLVLAWLDQGETVNGRYGAQGAVQALPAATAVRPIVDQQKAGTFAHLGKAPFGPFQSRLGPFRAVEACCPPLSR